MKDLALLHLSVRCSLFSQGEVGILWCLHAGRVDRLGNVKGKALTAALRGVGGIRQHDHRATPREGRATPRDRPRWYSEGARARDEGNKQDRTHHGVGLNDTSTEVVRK